MAEHRFWIYALEEREGHLMAVLASTAAARPQIYTNLQILDQLRETALWHDHITQELPSSLQYHINNLRLHVERASDHLHQAFTHVENIGAHPEHYTDSLARADGRHTMQPFYPKGQPKGRGKSRSMEPPPTATTGVQTDPIPPYHSMVSHPAPRTPAPPSTNPCPTIPEGPAPTVQTPAPSPASPEPIPTAVRPTQSTTLLSRFTGPPPAMGRTPGVHSPSISGFQCPGMVPRTSTIHIPTDLLASLQAPHPKTSPRSSPSLAQAIQCSGTPVFPTTYYNFGHNFGTN